MVTEEIDQRPLERPGPGKRFFSDEIHDRAWPAILGRPLARRIVLSLFTAALVAIDYITGSTIRFPAYYAAPILLLAWYDGFVWASVGGIGIVSVRFIMERWLWANVPWPLAHSIMNVWTSVLMILVLAWLAARAGRLTREVRLLWGLLPICMYCHRLRTEKNQWERLEEYIEERSQAEFTHGICPTCMARLK